jgi:hypothetical protein
MKPSQPPGQEEDDENDEQKAAQSRRRMAVRVISEVGKSTEDEHEKHDE